MQWMDVDYGIDDALDDFHGVSWLARLSADRRPSLLHRKRIIFHYGAFTEDATGTAEAVESTEQGVKVQIGFGQWQMILLALWPILDTGQVDVQPLKGLIA
jgi:hypothetical protein